MPGKLARHLTHASLDFAYDAVSFSTKGDPLLRSLQVLILKEQLSAAHGNLVLSKDVVKKIVAKSQRPKVPAECHDAWIMFSSIVPKHCLDMLSASLQLLSNQLQSPSFGIVHAVRWSEGS